MTFKKNQVCQVSRWEIHKSKLNNLDPAPFKTALEQDPEGILLDVRTASEYQYGSIAQATNMDYLAYDFLDRLEQLDPSKTYYVYCRSGRRSTRACTLMANSGFINIFHLDGGLNHWEAHFKASKK